ncbi:DNA repair protein RecN [Candidatus Sumerlaeota bacterium]|nr:DNA repair protein RecN [Candidatus Sumerlaeota bacterium]
MIRHLQIRNLALFDHLEVEFGRGLIVLTGESGAGKSLLIEALSLLNGERTAPSIVRSGADRTTVEALFEISPDCNAARRLTGLGLSPDGPADDEVILRRDVQVSGRGRASINGHLVPSSHLASLSCDLFELSGQHEQQSLLSTTAQRDFFDAFARLMPQRNKVSDLHHQCRAAQDALEELNAQERNREQRRDYLRFQVDELESMALRPGEQEELASECGRLANVDLLMRLGMAAHGALGDAPAGELCATDLVGAALKQCEQMAEHDGRLAEIVDALREAQSRLSDAGFELGRYLSTLDADPARLEEVQERLATLRRGLRKHGPTAEEALQRLAGMKSELETLENFEGARAAAEHALQVAREKLGVAAAELREARLRAKNRFLKPFLNLLRDFSMPKVRVDISMAPVTSGVAMDATGTLCGPAGAEEMEVLFSANEGEALHPLRKVASGGELSRVMLALRTLEAEQGGTPLLVFDEVDAGLSGAAARRVAERLSALGERCQILCVTHNPMIAAAANQHLIVEKKERDGRTTSTVCVAEGIRRQAELARLLDGGKQSAKGLALAAEMLEVG